MARNGTWQEVTLDSVANEVTVGWVGPMTHEYRDSGIPFLRSLNVRAFRIDSAELRYISTEFHTRIAKSRLIPGDVVIVRTGDPGTAAVIPHWLQEANCADLVIVRPGARVDAHYLAYFVNAVAHHQVNAEIVGAVQQHFNVGSAKRLRIPLPEIGEQQAIVRILKALDDKIELNRRMNATLEGLARALFKSWFVDFDPVTAKAAGRKPFGMNAETAALFPARFTDSTLGPIPEGWRPASVADLARYLNGRNFTKGATGSGRMVIRIAELNSGPGGSTVYNDVDAAPENTAYPGDLLFAWSGSLDVYRWYRDEALINQHIFKVICDDYPQWFVHQHLIEVMPFFQGIASGKATTMGHIKREHLRQADLAVPPGKILAAAERVVKPLYDCWLQNERETLTLAATRDALLPKLLSGEIRIKNAEKLVESAG